MDVEHPTEKPSLLLHGKPVQSPRLLWVGAGDFFRRILRAGTFRKLLDIGAKLAIADVQPIEERLCPHVPNPEVLWLQQQIQDGSIRYFNVRQASDRKNLAYGPLAEREGAFTHCYVANWPQAHLLSAVKYSALCTGGDIIITKPLDLNIPMVVDIKSGMFPDLSDKVFVDDHYRNKGSIRELHRVFPDLQRWYGKLRSFRMWLVEPTTIEIEGRQRALECGVIWDLATHLVSLIQLFFLDPPHLGLSAYGRIDETGRAINVKDVTLQIKRVSRKKYMGCELTSVQAETFAAIEVTLTFKYPTYAEEQLRSLDGLLIVGKGARRGEELIEPVKQLDFDFEGGHVSLNYQKDLLSPPLEGFAPREESGFHKPVIELLTHAWRGQEAAGVERSGEYAYAVPFDSAFRNIMTIHDMHQHDSSVELLRSYPKAGPIRDILNDLAAHGLLDRRWLEVERYGDFL